MLAAKNFWLWRRYRIRSVLAGFHSEPSNGIGKFESSGPLIAAIINLDSRQDRWRTVSAHLEAYGIAATRFAATAHSHGLAGCALSHAAVLNEAAQRGLFAITVLEDDVRFVGPHVALDAVLDDFLQNPALDVLCLAHVSSPPRLRVSHNLFIAHNIRTTAAYVVKRRALQPLVTTFRESALQIASGRPPERFALDILWQGLQKRSLLFAIPTMPLAIQSASYSDIQKTHVDYAGDYEKSFSEENP